MKTDRPNLVAVVTDYEIAASPFFCTRCSSLSAAPVGRFWPISHFCTVETLVFKTAAKDETHRASSSKRPKCARGV
jgi:hypothetical protein